MATTSASPSRQFVVETIALFPATLGLLLGLGQAELMSKGHKGGGLL